MFIFNIFDHVSFTAAPNLLSGKIYENHTEFEYLILFITIIPFEIPSY